MAEVAVAAPLFLLVLMAIAYFSQIVYTQQRLNVAVRYAARQMAIESTRGDLNRLTGAYVPQVADNSARVQELVARAMNEEPTRLQVSPVDATTVTRYPGLRLLPGGYAALFLATGQFVPAGSREGEPAHFGAGVLFFGCKVSYRLSGLDWVARILSVQEGITLQASSLMPAELPLHGQLAGMTYGLADLNTWVQNLATQDVDLAYRNRHLMDDLYR